MKESKKSRGNNQQRAAATEKHPQVSDSASVPSWDCLGKSSRLCHLQTPRMPCLIWASSVDPHQDSLSKLLPEEPPPSAPPHPNAREPKLNHSCCCCLF